MVLRSLYLPISSGLDRDEDILLDVELEPPLDGAAGVEPSSSFDFLVDC